VITTQQSSPPAPGLTLSGVGGLAAATAVPIKGVTLLVVVAVVVASACCYLTLVGRMKSTPRLKMGMMECQS
jgi:hypothetical protein